MSESCACEYNSHLQCHCHKTAISALNFANVIPPLSSDDFDCLSKLRVPLPQDESQRIRVLRESQLSYGTTEGDTEFDRLTSFVARALKVKY